jgi:hypothetical protein
MNIKDENSSPLKILVEGYTDKAVVENLLKAVQIDVSSQVDVVVCDGKKGVRKTLHELREHGNVVALIDADAPSVADSIAWAAEYLQTTRDSVFCAVPTIEAWIFADKELARKNARQSDYAQSAIARIATAESLVNPKHLVNQVFEKEVIRDCFPFMVDVDIGKAAAASASLFSFLRGIESALGQSKNRTEQRVSSSINRVMVANLLREIPAKTIGWRTLEGEYTAERLGDLVLQGDEVGLRYVSELLRLARDILAARAQHEDVDNA